MGVIYFRKCALHCPWAAEHVTRAIVVSGIVSILATHRLTCNKNNVVFTPGLSTIFDKEWAADIILIAGQGPCCKLKMNPLNVTSCLIKCLLAWYFQLFQGQEEKKRNLPTLQSMHACMHACSDYVYLFTCCSGLVGIESLDCEVIWSIYFKTSKMNIHRYHGKVKLISAFPWFSLSPDSLLFLRCDGLWLPQRLKNREARKTDDCGEPRPICIYLNTIAVVVVVVVVMTIPPSPDTLAGLASKSQVRKDHTEMYRMFGSFLSN